MALLPNGGGEYHGISLVEAVWKVVTVIFDLRFTAYIVFHDVIHGFQVGCGTGTASVEAKLIHQLMAMREEVLYTIFLDLYKEYYALDRDICLEFLEGYGVGPRACHILCAYCDRIRMVDQAEGYYGAAFQGFWG